MTLFSRRAFGVSPSWRSAVLVLALSIAACGDDSNRTAPIRLTYSGVGALGIFDPAVTLDPATNRVWMSYSAVDSVTSLRAPWGVGIRLGYTDNGGSVWSDNGLVTATRDVTVQPGISVTSPEPAVTVASPGTLACGS